MQECPSNVCLASWQTNRLCSLVLFPCSLFQMWLSKVTPKFRQVLPVKSASVNQRRRSTDSSQKAVHRRPSAGFAFALMYRNVSKCIEMYRSFDTFRYLHMYRNVSKCIAQCFYEENELRCISIHFDTYASRVISD